MSNTMTSVRTSASMRPKRKNTRKTVLNTFSKVLKSVEFRWKKLSGMMSNEKSCDDDIEEDIRY